MRWEDERYVRFYTRDTAEWLALSWHARGLFGLVLRAVDRAGVLPVGKLGQKGLAVAVHAPWIEVEGPLAELLEDGCVVWDEDRSAFLLPNYLAAQECSQSDAARKRASRERARAQFGGGSEASEKARALLKSRSVTAHGHEPGLDVTNGHDESHAVTPCRAVPNRAVPDQDQKLLAQSAEKLPPAPPSEFVAYVTTEWLDLNNPAGFEARARAAFPGVDPFAEAKKARGWELANPRNKKSKHGSFLWKWLARAHADVGKNGSRNGQPQLCPPNLRVDNDALNAEPNGRKML